MSQAPRHKPSIESRARKSGFRRSKKRRKKPSAQTSLTEAVRRVLLRMHSRKQKFCVFCIDSRLVISEASGIRFSSLVRRWPEQMIGTYDQSAGVLDIVDDLSEHFADRAADVTS